MFRFPGTLCLGGFLAISGAAWGQPTLVPQGSEFPIVASAPGDQVWPSISLSSTGGYITWQDSYIDNKGGGLGNAVLDTTFSPSRKTRVNNTIAGIHLRPKVQALGNDNAVVVWEGSVTATGLPAIYARFARNSNPNKNPGLGTNYFTGDIRVDTHLTGQKADPAVAALPDGSAIIVWSSYGQDGSMYGVFARRLLPTGEGKGP